jgi:hypothetical protein
MSANQAKADELIKQIYASWKIIYSDGTGEHRLPTSKKAIEKSKELLTELESLQLDDKYYYEKSKEIKEVLKNGSKRRFHVSKQVIFATILYIAILFFIGGLHKKPGSRYDKFSDQQIIEMKQRTLDLKKKNVASYEETIKAGRENYMTGSKKTEKEKDKSWKRLPETMEKYKQFIINVTPMSPQEYREYWKQIEINNKKGQFKGILLFVISLILYLIVSRRPAFMFWRKGADKEVFNKIENTVGKGVTAAAFASLYTVPFATVEKIHWSNGMITKGVSSFGTNILIFAIMMILVLAYFCMVAMTMPIRVVINFLRNFVFYI